MLVKKNGLTVYQGTTPSIVTLTAAAGYFSPAKYQVEFTKKGCPTQTVPLTATIDGWYFGNLLFGGILGMVIVDPATGAMWKLPDNVNTSLTSVASIQSENGKTIRIVDRSFIPRELEAQLIAVR